MTGIHVNHLAYALGSRNQDVAAAASQGLLVSGADALQGAGFSRHHLCTDDEDVYAVARRVFERTGIDASSVRCIVYATCLPQNGNLGSQQAFLDSGDVKHLMDFPVSRLQADFGMEQAFVIGLNQQACTGMLGSIRLARNMLLAEHDLDNILCITADRFPAGALYEQAYNLISDGGVACLVTRKAEGFKLLASDHLTNGGLAQACDDQTVGSFFSWVHEVVNRTLRKAGLDMQDIRWVVPQNTNQKAWQILSGLLGVERDKAFYDSMASCGHVISADNIINLKFLEVSGQLATGDKVLTFMAGFGSNWQCVILERV